MVAGVLVRRQYVRSWGNSGNDFERFRIGFFYSHLSEPNALPVSENIPPLAPALGQYAEISPYCPRKGCSPVRYILRIVRESKASYIPYGYAGFGGNLREGACFASATFHIQGEICAVIILYVPPFSRSRLRQRIKLTFGFIKKFRGPAIDGTG